MRHTKAFILALFALAFVNSATAQTYDAFDTDPYIQTLTGNVFSNANRTVHSTLATSLSSGALAQALEGKTAGKWYVEFSASVLSGNNDGVGISDDRSVNGLVFLGGSYFGGEMGWGYYNTNGHVVNLASTVVTGPTWTTGDIIGVAIDLTNKKLWWRVNNGSWVGTSGGADPATNTNGFSISSMLVGGLSVHPAINMSGPSSVFTANFGPTMTEPVPSGFTAGWTNTITGKHFGTFAGTVRTGNGAVNVLGGDSLVSLYTLTVSGKVNAAQYALVSSSFHFGETVRFVIYDTSGPAGGPGSLLYSSAPIPTLNNTQGILTIPLSPTFSVTNGTSYWMGLCRSGTSADNISSPDYTNGIRYYATAVAGVPDATFSASPSMAQYQYPLMLQFGTSTNNGGFFHVFP